MNVELGWYSQRLSCGVSRKTPAEYPKQGCANYGSLTRTVWDLVKSLTIFWKRQNQSCACAQRHCWLFLTHRSISRSEQLSKTDKRHASTCTGRHWRATTCNILQRLATDCYVLLQRHTTACRGMQRHVNACSVTHRHASGCNGMRRHASARALHGLAHFEVRFTCLVRKTALFKCVFNPCSSSQAILVVMILPWSSLHRIIGSNASRKIFRQDVDACFVWWAFLWRCRLFRTSRLWSEASWLECRQPTQSFRSVDT